MISGKLEENTKGWMKQVEIISYKYTVVLESMLDFNYCN